MENPNRPAVVELPRRIRRPHMDLKAYDERAKLTDEAAALRGNIATVEETVKAEHAARTGEAPADGWPESEAEKLLKRLSASLLEITAKAELIGGFIVPKAAPAQEAPPPPVVKPEESPAEFPQEIRVSLFRFKSQPKRIRDKAYAIAAKDAPVPVVIAELDELLAKS